MGATGATNGTEIEAVVPELWLPVWDAVVVSSSGGSGGTTTLG